MTLAKRLEQAGMSPEFYLYDNPRGFANEWSIYPIPINLVDRIRSAATKLHTADADANGRTVEILPVAELQPHNNLRLLDWTHRHKEDPALLLAHLIDTYLWTEEN